MYAGDGIHVAHVTEEGEALGDVGRYGEVIFEDLDELKRGRWVGLGCEDGVGKVLDEEHLGGAEEAVVIGLVVGPELGPVDVVVVFVGHAHVAEGYDEEVVIGSRPIDIEVEGHVAAGLVGGMEVDGEGAEL